MSEGGVDASASHSSFLLAISQSRLHLENLMAEQSNVVRHSSLQCWLDLQRKRFLSADWWLEMSTKALRSLLPFLLNSYRRKAFFKCLPKRPSASRSSWPRSSNRTDRFLRGSGWGLVTRSATIQSAATGGGQTQAVHPFQLGYLLWFCFFSCSCQMCWIKGSTSPKKENYLLMVVGVLAFHSGDLGLNTAVMKFSVLYLEKTKVNEKEAGVGLFKEIIICGSDSGMPTLLMN